MALPFLETFAVSKEPVLRRNALQAIRQIRSAHSIPVLLNELDDSDRHNSFSAMQGLLSLRSANSSTDWVPTMEEFLQSPDLWVAKARQWWDVEGKAGPPDSSLPASR
jgi:HEAT repeat protein